METVVSNFRLGCCSALTIVRVGDGLIASVPPSRKKNTYIFYTKKIKINYLIISQTCNHF